MYKTNIKKVVLKSVSMNVIPTSMSNHLPSFVEQYRRPNSDSLLKVVTTGKKMASIEEKKLKRFYKCTKFNLKTGIRSEQCFVCKNDPTVFECHLKFKHPNQKFYCCYCYPKISYDEKQIKEEMNANKLVTHMIEVHRHRRYQCNLCLYRAITPEHVNVHQSVIHSDIHKATINNKQLNGKSCKIIECPPVTPGSANKSLPTAIEFFKKHKHLRLNNDEKNNKNYQCVYCDYMNDNLQRVIEHCVQTHPDFTVLYYLPEPLVTSTHSPSRQQQFLEFDVFDNNMEPQDNRVTSTECESTEGQPAEAWAQTKRQCVEYVAENAFIKKQRVSAVQTSKPGQSNCGLSNKNLNKDSYPTNSAARRPNGIRSMFPVKVTKSGHWRPNQMATGRKPMPKSKKDQLKRQMLERTVRQSYQSDDSSDETSFKKMPKLAPNQIESSLPSLISPKKQKIDKKLVCLVCDGSDKYLTESTVGSHLVSFHKNKCKTDGNKIPFICPFCKNFFDLVTDSSIFVHQMNGCPKMPENAERVADNMIVSLVEFNKRKEQRIKENSTRRQEESQQKPNNKQKSRSKLVHLTDDDYEDIEIESTPQKRSPVESLKSPSPPVLKKQTDYQNISSVEEVVDSSDEPQPSTSGLKTMTTTITAVDTDSDDAFIELLVCLFCDHKFDNKSAILKHFETHLPELSNATLDFNRNYSIRNWINKFVDKQNSLMETQNLSDDIEWDYKCPICVKVCQIKHLRPKQFKTFWELRVHFWEHTLWTPVKCLLCKSGHPMPNCDHLIAKHLNTKHHEELVSSVKVIRQLVGDKVKTFFTPEQRQALQTNRFIEIETYEPIEQLIEDTLKQISDRHESHLRELAQNETKWKVVLPNVALKPLPALNFDDQKMVFTYMRRERKRSTEGRVLDVISLGSSSLDSEDGEEITTYQRKPNKKQSPFVFPLDHEQEDSDCFDVPNAESDPKDDTISQNKQKINNESVNTRENDNQSSKIEMNINTTASPQTSAIRSSQTCSDSPAKRFQCSQCDNTFENRKDVKNHSEETHPGLPIRFHRI